MADFGEYLKSLREQHKLSLRDVAARTGMSASYLTQIEHGRRRPPGPDILKKLAPVYGLPVKDLMDAAGYLDDIEPVKPSVSEEEEVDRAYQFAITDPQFKFGMRITGPVDINVKRFIVEMYEKATSRKLLTGE
ncbi:MAG: helix-turn-helix domain-containing protein [Deltaproteobacteria bacterium]|nr:helix-turn-helix domain-containing protein [Deltaproteobacteria bacterium]